MYVIPAIDLRAKKVVRLYRGIYEQQTVYSDDPVAVAVQWKEQGAELLHIVDLDGALSGTPQNLDVVRAILAEVPLKVHFGGGLRSKQSIDLALAAGVTRMIMSTKIFQDQSFLPAMDKETRAKIIVSIDSKSGMVMAKGWRGEAGIGVPEALKIAENAGIGMMVFTDVGSDGTLAGPNLEMLKKILEMTKIKVIAAGGITTLKDIDALLKLQQKYAHLYAGIIGKSLYEGKINLKEAITRAS